MHIMKKSKTAFYGLFGALMGALFVLPAHAGKVSVEDLNSTWAFYGIGSRRTQGEMFYMREDSDSKGVMIVSPEAFDRDVTVRYEIMPMSAASVCVVILSASDAGDGRSLTLPPDYDGAMGHWIQNVNNYFFAFHNAAHDRTPFAVRFPAKVDVGQHGENVMRSGEFHTVEAGRHQDRLWLKINDELILEGQDAEPLAGGHLAFRLRGISGEPASCLIRNLTIDTVEK
jgi:hypothetical protein